jgi:hypothetical protein
MKPQQRAQLAARAPARPAEVRRPASGSAGRGAARRRAAARLPWYRGRGALVSAGVAVLAIVVIFAIIANRPAPVAGIGDPVPANVLSAVTHVSPSVAQTVGTGGLPDPLKALQGQTPLRGADGKPELLYVGAEYCPYCAAERWSMFVALSRFGTLSNMHLMASSGTDVYPSTRTFTFVGSHYISKYLDFVPIENADRNQQPLQSLTTQQQQLFSSIGNNGYPFLDLAGQYSSGGGKYSGGYDPQVLQGLSWQQISSALSNPNDPVTLDIVGNANVLTAGICKTTNQQPATVCGTKAIQQIEQQLPK